MIKFKTGYLEEPRRLVLEYVPFASEPVVAHWRSKENWLAMWKFIIEISSGYDILCKSHMVNFKIDFYTGANTCMRTDGYTGTTVCFVSVFLL